MHDHELAELMYAQTDNAPPARIDLARVMREGRRQRRRFAPALAAAAVLVLAAASVVVFKGNGPAGSDPPVGSAPTVSTPAASPAPASFDPLRLRLRVGWVPAGLDRQEPVLATGNQQIVWSEPVPADRPPDRWVDVTIYAADLMPWPVAEGVATMQATESVNGAQAAWIVTVPRTPDPSRTDACGSPEPRDKATCDQLKNVVRHRPAALAWRWAPNAWAVARASDPDESTQRTAARQVAASVTADGDDQLPLPFTAKRLPAPLRLMMVEPYTPPPLYSVALRYGLGEAPMSSNHSDDSTFATLSVTWVPPGYRNKDTPNRTLDGANAAVHFESADWGDITLYRDGYEVNLWIPNRAGRQLIDEQTAIDIVTSVTPVAALSDRAHWSTNPLS